MALRNILKDTDPILHKKCRPVTDFDDRLWLLLDDMADTLHHSEGVGLAAPQVGVLRRVFIMDMGDGKGVIEAVNPEIVDTWGTQEGPEGCLSFPGEYAIVVRPKKARMKAQDRYGKWFYFTGEDLTARCMCHETDHLDGTVFKDRMVRMLSPDEY